MRLMSFSDTFGFFLFLLLMVGMIATMLMQLAWKNDGVKKATKEVGGQALKTGSSWLMRLLTRK